jgi:transposase
MREQLRRAGVPGPLVIGIDEISVKKGQEYRIVVSDLLRRRAIWFGGADPKEESMDLFYRELGSKKSRRIRVAVMDMWKAFRNSAARNAPQASILFDKFHVMTHLGEALDEVRKSEYGRLKGADRAYIKGQKYTLLSHRENLTLTGRQALDKLLAANKRLHPESDDLHRGSHDLKTQNPVPRARTFPRAELPVSGRFQRQLAKIRRAAALQRGLRYIS